MHFDSEGVVVLELFILLHDGEQHGALELHVEQTGDGQAVPGLPSLLSELVLRGDGLALAITQHHKLSLDESPGGDGNNLDDLGDSEVSEAIAGVGKEVVADEHGDLVAVF